MDIAAALRWTFADPIRRAYMLWGRWNRSSLFRRYVRLSRKAGVNGLYLVLSFDCDTPEDARVVWDVHRRVQELGVTPVYAVPGALLERGAAVYRQIAETGTAEFINHGYTEHTYFDSATRRYASCFFYDRLPRHVIAKDILLGDRALREVLGIQPRGFRAPHFGTFQKPAQLRSLHTVLKELGYRFSTSTTPLYGFRYGAVFDHFGLLEFPLSGMASRPLDVLDTWGCFQAPDRIVGPEDYQVQGTETLRLLRSRGCGILNYYADPLHIHNRQIFFDTVKRWSEQALSVTYTQLMSKLQEGVHGERNSRNFS